MELQDYLAIVRKRWVSILVLTVLAVGGAVAATVLTTPTYEARSQVFVSVRNTGGTSTTELLQGSNFTQNQVRSYVDLVTTPRVLGPVIEHLGLASTPDELAQSITADSPLDTVLINIRATNEDPQVASDIANATADSLATEVTALEKPANGPSPVQISTVRTASAPTEPASPNAKLNVALGLLVGLALGFGVAVLREVLDTRVRTQADVHQVTDASVIAEIGLDEKAAKEPLIVQSDPHGMRAESFRRLRTNLQFLDAGAELRTMVVASSMPGEGKTTTTINLAVTLADAGARVLLVDADLRRPSVAEYMGLEGRVGLTTVLIGRASIEEVVQPWGNGYLHVLPSGQIPPNPSELLGSRAMATFLERAAEEYDIVLIDTPPLLPVTDAAILARLTGGAIVVVGASMLNRSQLAESLSSLETVGARVLGMVLNRVPAKHRGDHYYYDYSPQPEGTDKSKRRRKSKTPERPPLQQPRKSGTRRLTPQQGDQPVEALLGEKPPVSASGNRWPGGPIGR